MVSIFGKWLPRFCRFESACLQLLPVRATQSTGLEKYRHFSQDIHQDTQSTDVLIGCVYVDITVVEVVVCCGPILGYVSAELGLCYRSKP